MKILRLLRLHGQGSISARNALAYLCGIALLSFLNAPLLAGKLYLLDCSEYRIRTATMARLHNEENEEEGNPERYTSVSRCVATIQCANITPLKSVDILSFRSCYFSDPAFIKLSERLPPSFPNLKLLDLSWNLIGTKSASSLLKWLDRKDPPFIVISNTGAGSYDVAPLYGFFVENQKENLFDRLIFETEDNLRAPLSSAYDGVSLPENWPDRHQSFYKGELGQFLREHILTPEETMRRTHTEMLADALQVTTFPQQDRTEFVETSCSFLTNYQSQNRQGSSSQEEEFSDLSLHTDMQHAYLSMHMSNEHVCTESFLRLPSKTLNKEETFRKLLLSFPELRMRLLMIHSLVSNVLTPMSPQSEQTPPEDKEE